MKPSAQFLILGLDFDGACVEHAYPLIGDDVGAVPWLQLLSRAGVRIILWTMRSHPIDATPNAPNFVDPLQAAVDWFALHKIELFGVNENPDQRSWTTSPKAYCHKYLDDAAHGCPLVVPVPLEIVEESARRPYVDWRIVGPQLCAWAEVEVPTLYEARMRTS